MSVIYLLVSLFFAVGLSVVFAVAMKLPLIGPEFRLVTGFALFVAIGAVIQIPYQARAAFRARSLVRGAAVVVECAAILIGLALWARCLLPEEKDFDPTRWAQIAAMAESGQLSEKHPGVIILPPELSDATIDGRVYVTRLPVGRCYLFKTFEAGRCFGDFRGFIYSTLPVSDVVFTNDRGNYVTITAFDTCENELPVSRPLELVFRVEFTTFARWLRISSR
jgi:hypothetical protein